MDFSESDHQTDSGVIGPIYNKSPFTTDTLSDQTGSKMMNLTLCRCTVDSAQGKQKETTEEPRAIS